MIGKNLHHFSTTFTTSRTAADLRRDITAWGALVWAYRDEKVHMATEEDWVHHRGPGLARPKFGEAASDGGIAAYLEAHDDAVSIDKVALATFGHMGRDRLAAFAEKAVIPPPEIAIARLRLVPLHDDRGRMMMIYPERGRHEAIACLVDYVGEWPEKAAAREAEWRSWHRLFLAFMVAIGGLPLKRWKIISSGY